jgi:hypothetical protein
MKTHTFRSPLKANPLHTPGQSLNEEIQSLYENFIQGSFLIAFCLTVIAVLEIGRWYSPFPPKPIFWTSAAVLAWVFVVYRMWKIRKQMRDLKQGRDGEKAVGQYLESLREQGASVYHDIPAKGFNVDHVVIAPQGVFVVETKTISKPARGKAEARVENQEILLNGVKMDRNPIRQAIAEAQWMKGILRESTGKDFPVRPVVVLPGWFVERVKKDSAGGAWVLNPKALPAFIAGEPETISKADVSLAAYHLSRYVRVSG